MNLRNVIIEPQNTKNAKYSGMLKGIKFVFLLLMLACKSVHLSSSSELVGVFKDLHRNVYDVYKVENSPDKIHNLLANSFAGEALTKEYIEHFTTIEFMEKEETSIDIRTVDYNDITFLHFSGAEVSLDVDWSVGGVVTHQRHKHTRVNRYKAVYQVELQDTGEWRIADTKMRNLERVRRATDEELLNGTNAGGGYLDPLDLLEAGILDEVEKEQNK